MLNCHHTPPFAHCITILEAVRLGNSLGFLLFQLGLRFVLALERTLDLRVSDLVEFGAHRGQLFLQLGRAQLVRVELDRELDVLQHLRIDALLALVLEPDKLDRQVGRQTADQRLEESEWHLFRLIMNHSSKRDRFVHCTLYYNIETNYKQQGSFFS